MNKKFQRGDRVKVEYRSESGSYVGEGGFVDTFVGFKGCRLFAAASSKKPDMCHIETVIGLITVPLKNVSPV